MMTNIEGLYAFGEVNYQYHGATRLGANALLSCIFDGLFCGVGVTNYVRDIASTRPEADARLFEQAVHAEESRSDELINGSGGENPYVIGKELGDEMTAAATVVKTGPRMEQALAKLHELRDRAQNLSLADSGLWTNQNLSYARAASGHDHPRGGHPARWHRTPRITRLSLPAGLSRSHRRAVPQDHPVCTMATTVARSSNGKRSRRTSSNPAPGRTARPTAPMTRTPRRTSPPPPPPVSEQITRAASTTPPSASLSMAHEVGGCSLRPHAPCDSSILSASDSGGRRRRPKSSLLIINTTMLRHQTPHRRLRLRLRCRWHARWAAARFAHTHHVTPQS